MNILVATEDMTFSVSLSHAYKAAGHAVSAGIPELYLSLRNFDLIHFHWPEELTGWEMPPRPHAVRRLLTRLDALKPRTKMVCTVHNLLPHADKDGAAWDLYNEFYRRMDCIGHFSESSREAVAARFPDIQSDRHIIHGMQDFADLRVHIVGQEKARSQLGIPASAKVVGVVGQMRSLSELSLLADALGKSNVAKMHLLRAFRKPNVGSLRQRVRRKLLMRSFDRRPVTRIEGYLENDMLVAVCEATDIIVIPRMENQLNSGVLPLAMTFAKGIVAPRCGVFREMLGGSMNELYAPGDPADLARAIARLAAKDQVEVQDSNRALAADWGWSRGVERILAADCR